jgi:hypothetical protein
MTDAPAGKSWIQTRTDAQFNSSNESWNDLVGDEYHLRCHFSPCPWISYRRSGSDDLGLVCGFTLYTVCGSWHGGVLLGLSNGRGPLLLDLESRPGEIQGDGQLVYRLVQSDGTTRRCCLGRFRSLDAHRQSHFNYQWSLVTRALSYRVDSRAGHSQPWC